jgi:hypothetical protein
LVTHFLNHKSFLTFLITSVQRSSPVTDEIESFDGTDLSVNGGSARYEPKSAVQVDGRVESKVS